MSGPDFSNSPDTGIVESYRSAAALHGRYTAEGDYTRGNAEAESIAAAYRELRQRGEQSQRALLRLLDDADPSVRSWAGAHALEFAPEAGEPVLEELATGSSIIAFDAKMTLREWRKGTLSFP
jgi:hypothetical protein